MNPWRVLPDPAPEASRCRRKQRGAAWCPSGPAPLGERPSPGDPRRGGEGGAPRRGSSLGPPPAARQRLSLASQRGGPRFGAALGVRDRCFAQIDSCNPAPPRDVGHRISVSQARTLQEEDPGLPPAADRAGDAGREWELQPVGPGCLWGRLPGSDRRQQRPEDSARGRCGGVLGTARFGPRGPPYAL